jgi:hypothetical protein
MRITMLLACCALTSCGEQDAEDAVDLTFNASMASQTLASVPFEIETSRVHAVCGPAKGNGLYEIDDFENLHGDGINDGRLVFVSARGRGAADVISRDAFGSYFSVVEDGGRVQILGGKENVWVISYESTGVTATHNIVQREGRLFDLWTVNKPISIVGPSVKLFKSMCVRP